MGMIPPKIVLRRHPTQLKEEHPSLQEKEVREVFTHSKQCHVLYEIEKDIVVFPLWGKAASNQTGQDLYPTY
jgi:hypothetical protein